MQSNKDANTLKRDFLKKWSSMDPKIEAIYAQFWDIKWVGFEKLLRIKKKPTFKN